MITNSYTYSSIDYLDNIVVASAQYGNNECCEYNRKGENMSKIIFLQNLIMSNQKISRLWIEFGNHLYVFVGNKFVHRNIFKTRKEYKTKKLTIVEQNNEEA